MDEVTWVRQHRMKKMARFAVAGIAGLLLALMIARPFQSAAKTLPPPLPPHPMHGPMHEPGGPEHEPHGPRRPKMALSAEHVAASVATATASQPGLITKTDGERDAEGRTVCVVDVQGSDGGHYHVAVDVAANKVLQVEAH